MTQRDPSCQVLPHPAAGLRQPQEVVQSQVQPRASGAEEEGGEDPHPEQQRQAASTHQVRSHKLQFFPNPHFRSSTTTESSGVYIAHGRELPVDEHGRIEPYVDFGPFYKLWSQRTEGIDTQQHSQRLE